MLFAPSELYSTNRTTGRFRRSIPEHLGVAQRVSYIFASCMCKRIRSSLRMHHSYTDMMYEFNLFTFWYFAFLLFVFPLLKTLHQLL